MNNVDAVGLSRTVWRKTAIHRHSLFFDRRRVSWTVYFMPDESYTLNYVACNASITKGLDASGGSVPSLPSEWRFPRCLHYPQLIEWVTATVYGLSRWARRTASTSGQNRRSTSTPTDTVNSQSSSARPVGIKRVAHS